MERASEVGIGRRREGEEATRPKRRRAGGEARQEYSLYYSTYTGWMSETARQAA